MATIAQKQLFNWTEVEDLGDLARLQLVLDALPDEELMRRLERERGRGRDDYPVRALWNSLLAGVVFQHPSIESLRRELGRNAQLRQLCGFDVLRGAATVPGPHVYSRFLKKLMAHQEEIDQLFDWLVEALGEALDGFGETLALDSKAIRSHARARREEEPGLGADGRRDLEADWGAKTYRTPRADGTWFEQVRHWFGYKLHLIVDADHELPVAYEVTKASASDAPTGRALVKKLAERHPALVEECEALCADKGYDDTAMMELLWDEHEIKPVIAIRNCWQEAEGDDTKRVPGQRRAAYDYEGRVYCYCPRTGRRQAMAYGGFEASRGTLKYRCPAKHYGLACPGRDSCEVKDSIRIKLSVDRRVFTPLARSSYAWERTYAKRTSVERVNSRLDVSFGFERHFIRGLAKMKLRCGLALVVMLAMALGHAKAKRAEWIRSLVRRA